jgi:hypothetical protein
MSVSNLFVSLFRLCRLSDKEAEFLNDTNQYCRQNLSSHVINSAVVTQLLIDGAAFF